MEEIVKGENVQPEDIPSNFKSLSPKQQVGFVHVSSIHQFIATFIYLFFIR